MICRQSCEQPSSAARIERVPQAESERDSNQSDSYQINRRTIRIRPIRIRARL